MSAITTIPNEGLFKRYNLTKISGEPVDPNAEYFVLRLDPNGKDLKHINACRKAIVTYANSIKDHLPELSKELLERYSGLIFEGVSINPNEHEQSK